MKISFVGWYGQKNVGDEAFRVVFEDFFSGHDLRFVTPPQTCDSDTDIVILGGGAVASPFYLKDLPDCPRYALGVDLAYESESDLLQKAQFRGIYVRNKRDVELLKDKVACPVEAIPDLAFYLKPTGADVLSRFKQTQRPTLGVFVTDYVNPAIDRSPSEFQGRATNFHIGLAKELDRLAGQGLEILLVPCSTDGYGDDRRVNLDLKAFMVSKPTVVMDTLGPQEMIDLIHQLNLTVCMRFHAHVFSMIARTPFVSIAFTRKVERLLQEHNLEKFIAVTQSGCNFDFTGMDSTIRSALVCDPDDFALAHRNQLALIKQRVRREWLAESV